MNASYQWLRAFVPFDLTPAALRDLVTAHTATVDEVVPLRADLAPIVVARVVEASRHPDSDHLSVTRVDAGGPELLDVVCGAPNVQAGRLYPFAPTGTTMPGGLKIERRKIRGQASNGMLCSARELGLGQEHDGIMELSVDAAPGTPFLDAMAVGDTRLVVDVLPNRPDLLSHAGLAREIAAVLRLPLRLPDIPLSGKVLQRESMDRTLEEAARALEQVTRVVEQGLGVTLPREQALAGGIHGGAAAPVAAELADTDGCQRYVGVTMRGVAVGASPQWLVDRIEAVGGRSINNVVDATNYVMHELGQPLHAFDAARLGDGRVVVRRAREGERVVTLDGHERPLTPEMTVIADADRAQAVAGVMGGRDSEVSEATTTIFLESASFDTRRTRATRRALGLSTDASHRFERGVDPELSRVALDRLVVVIQAVAGGEVVGEVVDHYPAPLAQRTVLVRVSRVARLLGEPVPAAEIGELLGRIGFGVSPAGDMDVLCVDVPSWRRADVEREADVIEEVARLRGYDGFSAELRPFRIGTTPDAPVEAASRRVRDLLVGAGLLEVRPMPFTAGTGDGAGFVRVLNPLAENEAYLRRELLDSLARRAEYNLAHMQGDLRLFEIGSAFDAVPGRAEPREQLRTAALVMGARRPPHFTDPEPPAFDAWDARALAERLAAAIFPGAAVALEPVGDGDLLWRVEAGGRPVGIVRRVALDAPVWAATAYGVEIAMAQESALPETDLARRGEPFAPLVAESGVGARVRALPTTPAAQRDVTLLVPDAVPAARVETLVRRDAGELLESLAVVGEFRSEAVGAGVRALTLRLTFRHPERTLRDKELEGRMAKLLRTLESEAGVRQRG